MNATYDLDTIERLLDIYQGIADLDKRLAWVKRHPGPTIPVVCLDCGEQGQVSIGWPDVRQALIDGCFAGKPRRTICAQCADWWDGDNA